jgi:aryl-alcohol dehydrogenase-like predicted oxidoreductase
VLITLPCHDSVLNDNAVLIHQKLTMAKIGLGLAALGRPGYINLGHAEDLASKVSINAMRKNAHVVLDEARELGVRYFDAARSYGRAEEFLASWIRSRNISPDEITVGSKWGYTYTAAWQVQLPTGVEHEVKRHELPVLKSQYAATIKNLGTHLNLYQIHSATLESGVLENQDVLEFLNRVRQAGIQVGLSVSGPRQSETIEQAISIKVGDVPLFGSVQATWNLLERSAAPALADASARGLTVIVKEAVANGRLTTKNLAPEFAEKYRLLQLVADENETSIDAVSMAAALNQPWASIALSGAANIEHLTSNHAAQAVNWTEAMSKQLDSLTETPQHYWTTRSRLAWN